MSGVALSEDLKEELDLEVAALKEAEGAPGVSSSVLRFHEAVARAHAAAREALRSTSEGYGLEAGAALAESTNGCGEISGEKRALKLSDIDFDQKILSEVLAALVRAVEGDKGKASIVQLARAAEEDRTLLERVVTASIPGGDARDLGSMAQGLELPGEALLLVGRLLAAPFLHEARLRKGPMPELDARGRDGLDPGRCPSCGSLPALGTLINEEGTKRLLCSLCGDSWLAPRLACPACGNNNHDKLGTLCMNEADTRWVEVCEECRRYVKTVDERQASGGKRTPPRATDARTFFLDTIAEEEGYVRSSF